MGVVDEPDPGLPLKLWPCSNGEYLPPPLDELRAEAMRRARAAADDHARRHGWSRRRFLLSSAGMASGLAVLQACSDEQSASTGTEPGGPFTRPGDGGDRSRGGDDDGPRRRRRRRPRRPPTASPRPPRRADVVVDVQTHFLESGEWGVGFPQGACGEAEPIDCFSAEYWRDLVLAGSDTAVAVISAMPVVGDADPLSIDAMERGQGARRRAVRRRPRADPGPRRPRRRAARRRARRRWPRSPRPTSCARGRCTRTRPAGWYLDDHDPTAPAIGGPFLAGRPRHRRARRRRAQGPVGRQPLRLAGRHRAGRRRQPRPDVPRVPLRLRDRGTPRARTTPTATASTASCAASPRHGIGPGGNVYAELGSTWRTVMGSPDEAAHVLGKLLVAFGPERILWGTDSIWYGSPQDQIAAFRTFEITAGVPGAVRLPGADAGGEAAHPRPERHRAVRHRRRRRRRAPAEPTGCPAPTARSARCRAGTSSPRSSASTRGCEPAVSGRPTGTVTAACS